MIWGGIKQNKFLLVIGILGLIFLFANLGNRYYWPDEIYTTAVSKELLKQGYPNVNEHPQLSHYEEYINEEGVWTLNSWSEYYITSLGFLVFGTTEFGGRFFFALIGFFTLFLFYFFVKDFTGKKDIACISTFLLATSTIFYLFSRNAKYYSITMFAVILILFSYKKFIEKKRYSSLYLIVSSLILFHTHIQIFLGVLAGVFFHYIAFELKNDWKRNGWRIVCVLFWTFVFSFPWFYLTDQFSKTSYFQFSLLKIAFNLGLAGYYILLFGIPFIFLFFLPKIFFHNKKINKKYFILLFQIIFVVIVVAILDNASTVSVRRLFVPLLPIFILINGVIISKIKNYKKSLALIILVLFVFTNILNLFPLYFLNSLQLENMNVNFGDNKEETDAMKLEFIEKSLEVRFYLFDLIYEITHDYISPDKEIINYLLKESDREDSFITNGNQIIIYEYTGLKSIMFKHRPNDENINSVDWVIIRKHGYQEFKEYLDANLDYNEYKKVTLPISDEAWESSPNPINHGFKTSREGEIVIYKRK